MPSLTAARTATVRTEARNLIYVDPISPEFSWLYLANRCHVVRVDTDLVRLVRSILWISDRCGKSDPVQFFYARAASGPHASTYLHRYLLQSTGCTLGPGDLVHHINGFCWDNTLKNLEVLDVKAHRALHKRVHYTSPLQIRACREFTNLTRFWGYTPAPIL